MWTKYTIRWDFATRLCASMPADPQIILDMLKARQPPRRPPEGKSIEDIHKEILETLPEEEIEPILHVFQRINGQPMLAMRTIRAHIKEMSTMLSQLYTSTPEGSKSFSVRVKNGIYYPPDVYWVPILHGDKPVTEISGTYPKPIHMMTRQGPRSSIKVLEFIEEASVEFPLWVLTPPDRLVKRKRVDVDGKTIVSTEPVMSLPIVHADDLTILFQYGGVHGYGGERGDGEGKYICTAILKQED